VVLEDVLTHVDLQLKRIAQKAQHCRLAARQACLLPERDYPAHSSNSEERVHRTYTFLTAAEIAFSFSILLATATGRRLQSDDSGIALDIQMAANRGVSNAVYCPQANVVLRIMECNFLADRLKYGSKSYAMPTPWSI
jgi:hypothetical protein